MERKLAVITGADGGMGTEITRAVACAGYDVIMACYSSSKAETKCRELVKETGNEKIEVWQIDLASLASVRAFADRMLRQKTPVALLMNNAGTMETGLHITEDGLERTVSVNYVGPYLLTRLLLPLMGEGPALSIWCLVPMQSVNWISRIFFFGGEREVSGVFLSIAIPSLLCCFLPLNWLNVFGHAGLLSMRPIRALCLPISYGWTSGSIR